MERISNVLNEQALVSGKINWRHEKKSKYFQIGTFFFYYTIFGILQNHIWNESKNSAAAMRMTPDKAFDDHVSTSKATNAYAEASRRFTIRFVTSYIERRAKVSRLEIKCKQMKS